MSSFAYSFILYQNKVYILTQITPYVHETKILARDLFINSTSVFSEKICIFSKPHCFITNDITRIIPIFRFISCLSTKVSSGYQFRSAVCVPSSLTPISRISSRGPRRRERPVERVSAARAFVARGRAPGCCVRRWRTLVRACVRACLSCSAFHFYFRFSLSPSSLTALSSPHYYRFSLRVRALL